MAQEISAGDPIDPQRMQGGPLLVVLSGPSGVGKDAVVAHMRRRHGHHCHFVVTATTRPKRAGEKDGLDYFFISQEQFQEMLDRGDLLEHAQVYGRWYGVPRPQVKDALEKGLDVVIKIDVQGAATLKKVVSQGVLIFLASPSWTELERRLRQRKTESPQQLALRIRMAREEMKQLPMFDYVVVNYEGHLEETVAQLEAIITAEKRRIPPRRAYL